MPAAEELFFFLFLEMDAELSIGDPSHSFFTGQTGSLDFDATNSPDFAALMEKFTDGIPKSVSTRSQLLLNGVTLNDQPYGSVGTGEEHDLAALDGAQIDFVRLLVNSVYENVDANGSPYQVSVLSDVTWQFWGECADALPAQLRYSHQILHPMSPSPAPSHSSPPA